MADDPITWLALDAMEAKLAQILRASDFFTDLGAAPVLRERTQAGEAQAPFTLLVATSIDPIEASSGPRTEASEMLWTLEHVQPYSADLDIGPDRLAHRTRADVVRAFKDTLRSDVGRIFNLRVDGCEITGDTDSQGAAVVVTQVTGRITVSETKQPATP